MEFFSSRFLFILITDKCQRKENQRTLKHLLQRVLAPVVRSSLDNPTTSQKASSDSFDEDEPSSKEPATTMETQERNETNEDEKDNEPLLFLHRLVPADSIEFRSKRINSYVNEEKMSLLEAPIVSNSANSKPNEFARFVKTNLDDSRLRGQYLLGRRVTHLDCMLDLFHHLAHTKNFNIMYFYARTLVNKLVKLLTTSTN